MKYTIFEIYFRSVNCTLSARIYKNFEQNKLWCCSRRKQDIWREQVEFDICIISPIVKFVLQVTSRIEVAQHWGLLVITE